MSEADPKEKNRGRPFLSGAAAGLGWSVLMLGAFPPLKLWPLVFVAPLCLGVAAKRAGGSPKRTAIGFGVGSWLFWGVSVFWTASISVAGWPPMVVYLSLWPALAVWLVARFFRSFPRTPMAVLLPIGLTAAETLRARVVFDGFFWYAPAQPLIDARPLAWGAAFVGVLGLCAMLAVLAGLVLDLKRPVRGRGVVVGVLVAAGWASASLHWLLVTGADDDEPQTARIAAVQTNLPQSIRGGWGPVERLSTMRTLMEQSARAAEAGAELIVWPETLFPGDTIEAEHVRADVEAGIVWILPEGTDAGALPGFAQQELLQLGDGRMAVRTDLPRRVILPWQRTLGVPLIVGAGGFDNYRVGAAPDGGLEFDWNGRFNSVYLIQDGLLAGERYDKLRLTPFGEEMPYISAWPWLEQQMLAVGAQGMSFDLDSGTDPVAFELETDAGPIRVAAPICFEATEPWVIRKLLFEGGERRADVMVHLTNEGWFGSSDMTRTVHMDLVRWQAMLWGTPAVRSANTGRSVAVDARGGLVSPVDGFDPGVRAEGVLLADVPLATHATPYARLAGLVYWGGEWGGWACVLAAAVMLIVGRPKAEEEPKREGPDA